MYPNNYLRGLIATAALVLGQSTLQAAPLYAVNLNQGDEEYASSVGAAGSLTNQGGTLDRTFFQADSAGNYSFESTSASAGPGGLRSNSSTTIYMANANNIDSALVSSFHDIESVAAFLLDDFIITGPGSDPVLGSLNLDLSGSAGGTTFTQNGNDTNGARTNAVIEVQGYLVDQGNSYNGRVSSTNNSGTINPPTSTGILDGYGGAGSATVTTPESLLPINTPFTVYLALVTIAESRTTYTEGDTLLPKIRIAEADSDFSSTLTFTLDGPVFNLPTGYTINSVSADIVDNQIIPIPAAAWLFGSGLLGLVGIARRRRKTSSPPQRRHQPRRANSPL